jgi:hypothetical protein
MIQRRLQRTAAAAVLAATLGLAAPAHAVGGQGPTAAGPAWLETALHWVAQLWPGAADSPKAPNRKSDYGGGIDPNGGHPTPPQPSTTSDYGSGIDPNG